VDRSQSNSRETKAVAAPSSARTTDTRSSGAGGAWIFAYGSLMWRPGFEFLSSGLARLHGYHRSLCIYSWVHRGTRDRPGLVFGLDRGGACKGHAFQVAPEREAEVIAYLDERELVTDVYQRKRLPFMTEHGRVPARCYVVRRDHEQYAGRLTEDRLMALIRHSQGVSGDCRDYILSTVGHLEEMGVLDFTLKSLVAQLQDDPGPGGTGLT
jgi:cation transport protein ChaC